MRATYSEENDILSIYEDNILVNAYDSPKEGDVYQLDGVYSITIGEELLIELNQWGEFVETLKVKMI